MPTLETTAGKPVEVTPADPETINAAFRNVMDGDGPADESAPPKRQPRQPAEDRPSRARTAKADKSRTAKAAPAALDDQARAAGVAGLAQIAAAVPLMLAKTTGNPAWTADAVTIANAAPQIADACVQVARNDARFAAALDRVCSSGPYAALVSVGLSVGMQCVRNHRPAMALPGTVHPDELVRSTDGNPAAAAA